MNVNLPENSDSLQQQQTLDGLPALIFLERAGRIVFANLEARDLLGWVEDKWSSRPVEEVLWGLFPGTAEPQTPLTGGAGSSPFHATMATRSGRLFPVEGTYCTVNAELREAVIVAQPVGRERTPRPRLMEDVLACIPEAVVIVRGSNVLYANAAFTRMFGYMAEEVSGGELRNFIVPETRQYEHVLLQRRCEESGHLALETVRMNKSGELLDVAMCAAPLLVNGERAGHVLTYRDIGERKRVEATLDHDAMHDVLTGLPKRAVFFDRVNRALTRLARRRDPGCGLLSLDLDQFEKVNSRLGYAAGDMIISALAERLSAILRPQDTASRLGGDEFAILVENVLDTSDLEIVAKRILKEMDRPFEILGHAVIVKLSIGIALAGTDEGTAESLMADADRALFHAKQAGGRRYEVFDRRMGGEIDSLQERERDLRRALSNRKLELWYEPIFRLATGELEGFESQLRFRRANGSIDSFSDLLSTAEETGLSISIGREALEAVCRQLRDWGRAIPGNTVRLAVNLTHRQFYCEDFVPHLKRTLAATKADPSRLTLEVPEAILNERPDAALAIVQRVTDCGVGVALDHFGAGLASFNHLVRLPLQAVKMEPLLTMAATRAGRQRALVESLIHLCKSAGVELVGQGIESLEQVNALRRLECELGQGPEFSEALEPTSALEMAVERHRTLPLRLEPGEERPRSV
jgi:Amt family ammonium transporter